MSRYRIPEAVYFVPETTEKVCSERGLRGNWRYVSF